ELPYQQTKAADWRALCGTLLDMEFLETKAEYGGDVEDTRVRGLRARVFGGVQAIREDFRFGLIELARASDVDPEVPEVLRLTLEAIDLGAHKLRVAPHLLFQEIYNTLSQRTLPERLGVTIALEAAR